MLACGLNSWRRAAYRPKQGLRLHYSKDMSYFSVRLALSYYSLWLLVGWGWRWRKPK